MVNEIKGVKKRAYDLLTKNASIKGQYRTYDYMTVKKRSVYLEPIRIFTDED